MNQALADKLMLTPLETPDFKEVANWLRNCTSEERVLSLKRHFDHRASYRLAISSVNNRKEAAELVQFGLDAIVKPHSQQTKSIIQFGIVKIGVSRTVSAIAERIESQPHVVDMAVYWFPRLVSDADLNRSRFADLQHKAQEKGIIRPPRRIEHPDGTVTYADRYAD
jgi:hypothetical protein